MGFPTIYFLGVCPGCGTALALYDGHSHPSGKLGIADDLSHIGTKGCQYQIEELKKVKQLLIENPTDFIAKIDENIRQFEMAMGSDMCLSEDARLMKEKRKA